jgi:hypothetical protein
MKAERTAYQRLIDDLRNDGRAVKDDGTVAQAQCPAHDDNTPSLSVTAIEGRVLVHCHAGCQTDLILAALGRNRADLFDTPRGTSYRYSDGRIVNRKPNKAFSQQGNTGGSALYRVEKIGDAATVYVCEGEQDVDAIKAAGAAAVCSAMGAGKAHLADWKPLSGKDVIVVADRDVPGCKHARDVVASWLASLPV